MKELSNNDMKAELLNIGFDKSYVHKAQNKFEYKNFKIYNLTCAQANIIKQTALTVGADCGTHREVITGKIEKSDCILGGSVSQLQKIADKLQNQPFGLKLLGQMLIENLQYTNEFSQTKLMGILNVTTNSFSDGGAFFKFDDAIRHLNELIADGADIIDIGAESTKPYSSPVSADNQLNKLIPILQYINDNNITIPVSIDTRSAKVAQKCIELGATIINDVSGFDYDSELVDVIAKNPHVKVIIQHSKGTPETMQDSPDYTSLMDEIYFSLKYKIDYALSNGVKIENIIVDPGIGFGKTKVHNFEILQRWKELKTLGCPVLIGLSRKRLLEMPQASNDEKDIYSLALGSILINDGIDFLRVHNVKLHKTFQNILK